MGKTKLILKEGQKFGKWSVIKEVPPPDHRKEASRKRRYYLCVCECGKELAITVSDLKNGHTKGCAQCHGRIFSRSNFKHGDSSRKDPQYKRLLRIWYGMLNRCHGAKPKSENKNYQDKGIKVCDEWRNADTGYFSFREWALSHNYADNLTIDRIDPNKDYSPDNCKWATLTEQARNKSNTIWVEVEPGKKLCIADAIKFFNNDIRPSVVYRRIFRGWSLIDSVSKPITRPKAVIMASKKYASAEDMDSRQALKIVGRLLKREHNLLLEEVKALNFLTSTLQGPSFY